MKANLFILIFLLTLTIPGYGDEALEVICQGQWGDSYLKLEEKIFISPDKGAYLSIIVNPPSLKGQALLKTGDIFSLYIKAEKKWLQISNDDFNFPLYGYIYFAQQFNKANTPDLEKKSLPLKPPGGSYEISITRRIESTLPDFIFTKAFIEYLNESY